ncbi:ubiquitin-specific protease ubp1 [Basidiobolus ranarum]|uniref:Ubiquitin carboxyl-terminal hydrolase n=1 Tax=Basidiobolus ranarum TaxID=34480 RepID=A0ABR2W959_9FUNG
MFNLNSENIPVFAVQCATGVASILLVITLYTNSISKEPLTIDKKRRRKKKSKKQENSSEHSAVKCPYYSGLVNLGNTCFLNSILQSLAALKHLRGYLEKCCVYDLSNSDLENIPITFSLNRTVYELSRPLKHKKIISPYDILKSLDKKKSWISSRQEQDAHELFQLISSWLSEEAENVFSSKLSMSPLNLNNERAKLMSQEENPIRMVRNPFIGFSAHRISCVQCGYTDTIKHYAFDNISLILPRTTKCTLEECLQNYTSIDSLTDFSCRQCSLNATRCRIMKSLEQATSEPKISLLKKTLARIEHALAGDLSTELPDIKITRITSKHTTKQVMFARPPPILCLHLSRSIFLSNGMSAKNSCLVEFPVQLDLNPFCTDGHLSVSPLKPISIHRKTSPDNRERSILYTLKSVVVHYGSHYSGHFATYRRQGDESSKRWLRISDDKVEEVDLEEVLNCEAYMLFYEK